MSKALGRRQLLRLVGAALGAGVASPAIANIEKADFRSVALHNLHTGERAEIDYWVDGNYVPDALQSVNHLLRDYRNGEVHAIAPNLLDLVALLQRRVGSSAEVQVISGYRSPATNAIMHEHSAGVAAHSLHMQGMAMDIRLGDIALDRLHAAALAMRAGGVGYYPSLDFVHVDVGRVRQW
jgi:uncharacterized protein YcbK (DUF882 family)